MARQATSRTAATKPQLFNRRQLMRDSPIGRMNVVANVAWSLVATFFEGPTLRAGQRRCAGGARLLKIVYIARGYGTIVACKLAKTLRSCAKTRLPRWGRHFMHSRFLGQGRWAVSL